MRVPNLPIEELDGRACSLGILSSYPPTACGIATFSAALATGLAANDAPVGVMRVVDTVGQASQIDLVASELVNGSRRPLAASSTLLNQFDLRWCNTSTASTEAAMGTRCSRSSAISTNFSPPWSPFPIDPL